MKIWTDPKAIRHLPILATIIIQSGTICQLWQMWAEQSVVGQSLVGWCLVSFALSLWIYFYFICARELMTALICIIIGFFMNLLGIGMVMWFRFFA